LTGSDEAVADLVEGGVVADFAGFELVVVGADFGIVQGGWPASDFPDSRLILQRPIVATVVGGRVAGSGSSRQLQCFYSSDPGILAA
jgi:hypothetical protein